MDRVTGRDAVAPEDTYLFAVIDSEGSRREAILIAATDGVHGWINKCTHWKAALDHGDGAKFQDGKIVCQSHGATFDPTTGACTDGPCDGDALEPVDVAYRDDAVVLTDDRYDLVTRTE